jgi:integrase
MTAKQEYVYVSTEPPPKIRTNRLDKLSVLKKLMPRMEPYWGVPQIRGQHVGYRRGKSGENTWIARLTIARQRTYKALGLASDAFGYEAACAAAAKWFKAMGDGTATQTDPDIVTVADGCAFYVEHKESIGKFKTAIDARLRFARHVDDNPLGKKKLATVTGEDFEKWRKSLDIKAGNYNRTVNSLKAALNLLVKKKKCDASRAVVWKDVEKMPTEKVHRRMIVLTNEQWRALIAQCGEGTFGNFVNGARLTGARGGELASAKVSQFDARTMTMDFGGKTGERRVPISKSAADFFTKLAEGRNPNEYLFECDERWSNKLKCRIPESSFITHKDGRVEARMWTANHWCKMFRKAADDAGLPKKTVLYTLRHTWITEMLNQTSMSLLTVARMTGTSLKMIDDHYGHLRQDKDREQMETVDLS